MITEHIRFVWPLPSIHAGHPCYHRLLLVVKPLYYSQTFMSLLSNLHNLGTAERWLIECYKDDVVGSELFARAVHDVWAAVYRFPFCPATGIGFGEMSDGISCLLRIATLRDPKIESSPRNGLILRFLEALLLFCSFLFTTLDTVVLSVASFGC